MTSTPKHLTLRASRTVRDHIHVLAADMGSMRDTGARHVMILAQGVCG